MGPMKPGSRAGGLAHAFGACHSQRIGDAGQFLRLHGIQFMVAADDQRDHVASLPSTSKVLTHARRFTPSCALRLRDGARVRRGYFGQRL